MTSVERRPLLDSYVRQRTLYPHLRQLVRPDASNGPLTSYCLVSGIVSAAALDASGTFVGLQTANVLQLITAAPAVAAGRHNRLELLVDLRRLLALVAFSLGAFATSRVAPSPSKSRTRSRVIVLSFVIAVLLAVAAGLVRVSDGRWNRKGLPPIARWSDASGMVASFLLAFVLGSQGCIAQRMSTASGETVALTPTLVGLLSDPLVFAFAAIPARTQRCLAIVAFAFGAIVFQLVVSGTRQDEGDSIAVGIAAAISFLATMQWWFVKGDPPDEAE